LRKKWVANQLADMIAIAIMLGCVILTAVTLEASAPSGSVMVYTNNHGEMWPEIVLIYLAVPFGVWRVLRLMWKVYSREETHG